MLTPKAHTFAIYIAFLLLTLWLLLGSLLAPYGISVDHGGHATATEESEKQQIDRRIADYTFGLAVFTGILALSTIGLWVATDLILHHGRDTTKKQLRAYVSVEPDGISDYNPSDRIIARVRFCNTGSVFAKRVATSICCELSEDGEREAFSDGKISGNNVIAPRAEILRSADEAITKRDIDLARRAAKNVNKQLYLYVWGIVQYHDGFTGERWTRYYHRYNFSALDEGKYDIPEKNYRYHHKGNQVDDKE